MSSGGDCKTIAASELASSAVAHSFRRRRTAPTGRRSRTAPARAVSSTSRRARSALTGTLQFVHVAIWLYHFWLYQFGCTSVFKSIARRHILLVSECFRYFLVVRNPLSVLSEVGRWKVLAELVGGLLSSTMIIVGAGQLCDTGV